MYPEMIQQNDSRQVDIHKRYIVKKIKLKRLFISKLLTVLMGITLDQDISAVLYLNVYFHCFFFFYFASSTVFNANGDIILYFWLLHICTNTLCSCNITGTVVAILVLARLYKLLVSGLLSLTYTYHIGHTQINNRGIF